MMVNYAEVGWLKNPAAMPPGVAQAFRAAGITESDYATILGADPFSKTTAIDPSRFIELSEAFPFEPVSSATETPANTSVTLTSESKSTSSTTGTQTVSLTVTVGAKVNAVFADLSLKVSDAFTYTHSQSLQKSNDQTQSAAFTIAQPAFGYTGGSYVFVYWDTVFQTFLFDIPAASATASDEQLSGVVKNKNGASVARTEVSFTLLDHTYRTMTDSRGFYKIFGKRTTVVPRGATGLLTIRGTTFPVVLRDGSTKHDVVLPT